MPPKPLPTDVRAGPPSRTTRKGSVRYRALTDLSLRERPDRTCNDWHQWPKGTVFTPPPHMNVGRALERGTIEPVADGGQTEVSGDD